MTLDLKSRAQSFHPNLSFRFIKKRKKKKKKPRILIIEEKYIKEAGATDVKLCDAIFMQVARASPNNCRTLPPLGGTSGRHSPHPSRITCHATRNEDPGLVRTR